MMESVGLAARMLDTNGCRQPGSKGRDEVFENPSRSLRGTPCLAETTQHCSFFCKRRLFVADKYRSSKRENYGSAMDRWKSLGKWALAIDSAGFTSSENIVKAKEKVTKLLCLV